MAEIVTQLKGVAEFTFLDAPFFVEFCPDDVFPVLAEGDRARAWWTLDQPISSVIGGKQAEMTGVAQSLALLREADAAEEQANGKGFDCVWGFSQGGALATLIVALLSAPHGTQPSLPQPPLRSLRCAVFVAARAYHNRVPAGTLEWKSGEATYLNAFPPAEAPVQMPSLHCFGDMDDWVKPECCQGTVDMFCASMRTIHSHDMKGHRVPSDAASLEAFDKWVREQARHASHCTSSRAQPVAHNGHGLPPRQSVPS